MTQLHKIIQQKQSKKHATDTGTQTHRALQHIVIENDTTHGDINLINKIKSTPNLIDFFAKNAKTEMPIAGFINSRFISRRIDRVLINHTKKTISFIDYKTDLDHKTFYQKYINQLNEYATLLQTIHPDYHITGYILWTHDFSLEKII